MSRYIEFLIVGGLILFSCQKVSRPDEKAKDNTAAPAQNAPAPPAPGNRPAEKPADAPLPVNPDVRLYASADFTTIRNLPILQPHAARLRELARGQGLLGRLVVCGADPLASLDRVQAVLPADFRKRPQGYIAASGSFDAAAVRACLKTEFQKENYRHETAGDADVFSHPRLSFTLTSPAPGRLEGVSSQWTDRAFPEEVNAAFRELGTGILQVAVVGAISPKFPDARLLALVVTPEKDALSVRARVAFSREDVAAALQAALQAQLRGKQAQLAASTDMRMQAAARVLEKLSIQHEKNMLSLSLSAAYPDLLSLAALFQVHVRKTL